MANILCHEIGHILGLRHEFAATKEKEPSVLWGLANPESVMNYFHHPLEMAVQESDVMLVNDFYFYFGETLERLPIDKIRPLPGSH